MQHVNLIFCITMGRTRNDLKLEIVRIHRSGTSIAGIRRRLISMGHSVSRDTISCWRRKYEVGLFGNVCDLSAPTVSSSVSQRDADLFRDCLTRDPSRDSHIVLRKDGAKFEHSTTKMYIYFIIGG